MSRRNFLLVDTGLIKLITHPRKGIFRELLEGRGNSGSGSEAGSLGTT